MLAVGGSLFVDDERLPASIAVAKQPIEGEMTGQMIYSASTYQGRKTFMNSAGYVQATWQAYEGRLGLTGGLRHDQHNVYGGQRSHRVGLVGSPLPNLHAKLLHGSAFQAPSPFLLHAVPASAGDVVGNPQLRPQYVNTYEFQLEYQPGAAFNLATDVAYSLLDDKTEFIQQGINRVARNLSRITSLSWESRAELKFREWLNAHVSFEMQRTVLRNVQPGYLAQLVGTEGSIYPRMMIHGGLAVQLGNWPLRAAIMASYIGTRRASETNIFFNAGAYTLPPYVLLDANLATRGFRVLSNPEQEVSFSISGKNLLGATGPVPGFFGVDYPLAPRALFGQMKLTL